jgi:hypothetical protein
MKHAAAASLLTGALLLVAANPSHAGGRVVIGGPVFYWGAPYPYPYPYYPYPYYGYYNPYYNPYEEQERREMAQVRLTTEPALLSGCTRLGVVTDDSARDMRRKIVRAGGNAASVSFPIDDLHRMRAEVYRCATAAKAPAENSRKTPSDVPPPPAGSPPPPPAGPSR